MKPDKQWTVTLSDGRRVIIGSGIDGDRGVWLLSTASLLRWMTQDDADAIANALRAAGRHLEAHPLAARGGTRRRKARR